MGSLPFFLCPSFAFSFVTHSLLLYSVHLLGVWERLRSKSTFERIQVVADNFYRSVAIGADTNEFDTVLRHRTMQVLERLRSTRTGTGTARLEDVRRFSPQLRFFVNIVLPVSLFYFPTCLPRSKFDSLYSVDRYQLFCDTADCNCTV